MMPTLPPLCRRHGQLQPDRPSSTVLGKASTAALSVTFRHAGLIVAQVNAGCTIARMLRAHGQIQAWQTGQ
jgi:hypothetical protein